MSYSLPPLLLNLADLKLPLLVSHPDHLPLSNLFVVLIDSTVRDRNLMFSLMFAVFLIPLMNGMTWSPMWRVVSSGGVSTLLANHECLSCLLLEFFFVSFGFHCPSTDSGCAVSKQGGQITLSALHTSMHSGWTCSSFHFYCSSNLAS